ncbi:MAG TPA: ATP-binding protein [Acidimicrobiales bacterium]|nr:ATP-binding protein [Acidimicrobiales bacterium]
MPGLTTMGELVRLELPAQPAFVGVARSVVAAVAGSIDGIDDDRLEDLRVAVSEACTNAVASEGGDDARVIVRCTLREERFEVVIEDTGTGLDPASLPDTDAGGWGLQLIEALVDGVTFRAASSGGGGTAVELVMQLEATPAG